MVRKHNMEMYLTHNERKYVVAKKFMKTLKKQIYKHMTSISQNVYIDQLDDIVNEYNNAYRGTIKMKPTDIKDHTQIESNKVVNDKDPRFQVSYHVRTSK